jgi:hypothetical protein
MVESSDVIEKYGFIITKPLQLMVVMCILEELSKDVLIDLLIVDCFEDAKGLSRRLSEVMPDSKMVYFFDDHKKAFNLAITQKYVRFFIDSDVGFLKNASIILLSLLSSRTILSVYEEGHGTYRNDLYVGLKRKILKYFGCGVDFGGNWFTKELYIFNPEKYIQPISAKKIKIRKSISSLLKERQQIFDYFFNSRENFKYIKPGENNSKKCTIYLTSWIVDYDQIEVLRKTTDLLIIKPHPHLRNHEIFNKYEDIYVVKGGVPAEMLILWISGQFEMVEVYHHGSSVVRYLQELRCTFRIVN